MYRLLIRNFIERNFQLLIAIEIYSILIFMYTTFSIFDELIDANKNLMYVIIFFSSKFYLYSIRKWQIPQNFLMN